MHYYKPFLSKPEASQQKSYKDQFGGLPWGFPVEKWPFCKSCKSPLSLVAQLKHHDERLPLGKDGRILYLFHCEAMKQDCPSYEADSGANAVMILEPEERTTSFSNEYPESLIILPNAFVEEWNLHEKPNVQHSSASFDYQKWIQFDDTIFDPTEPCTRLGGVPDWFQIPEPYAPPYYFAGQIYHQLEILSSEDSFKVVQDEHYRSIHLSPSSSEPEEIKETIPFAHFGDNGMGYLFVNPDPDYPTGYFLWQSK